MLYLMFKQNQQCHSRTASGGLGRWVLGVDGWVLGVGGFWVGGAGWGYRDTSTMVSLF